MTTFKRTTYVGDRPVCTNQPIMVTGGFTLDTKGTSFAPGTIIPAGTLAHYDEITRKAQIIKTGRVKNVSEDKKVITLETSAYLRPIFATGEVITAGSEKFTITKTEAVEDMFTITLDKESAGLKAGTVIWIEANIARGMPMALVIADTVVTDPSDQTGIDISIDSGAGAWYLRRIPPLPNIQLYDIENNLLKTNPNIKFTQSS